MFIVIIGKVQFWSTQPFFFLEETVLRDMIRVAFGRDR